MSHLGRTPLVSIGIPFFNDKKYIAYAIQSVLAQTYQNWELILIDDGSTDGSLEIAKSFGDNRIRIVSDGTNKGLPTRLNELVKFSRGEYFARMDADDIMHPNRIETQLSYLESNPDVDVLGTSAYIINRDNEIIGRSRPWEKDPKCIRDIFIVGSFIHPSVMAKKSWFESNPYELKLRRMQDLELWIRTLSSSKFHSLSTPLLFYRAIDGNVTKKYLSTQRYSRDFFLTVLVKQKREVMLGVVLYFKSYIKSFIYLLSTLFGNTEKLVKKRYMTVKEEKKIDASNCLKQIISVH